MSKLHEYRAFVTVVENRSVTLAAEKLHRSTSAVSKQLAKLEGELGVQLIDRTTQSIVVTRAGETFFHQCKAILHSVDEAERSIRENLDAPAGRLSISVPEGLLSTSLIQYLGEFTRTYEDVRLDIRVSNEVDDLLENQIDFAFRIADVEDGRLCAIPLSDIELLAVASPEYCKRHNLPGTIEELLDSDHLIVPTYVHLPRIVGMLAPDRVGMTFNLEAKHTTDNMLAMLEMARGGLGVAIVSDFSVQGDIADGVLVNLMPDKSLLSRTVHLIYRRRDFMPKLLELFKEHIRKSYASGLGIA